MKKIGMVGVDSGCLMIGDPCYFTDDSWTSEDYDREVCTDWDKSKQILDKRSGAEKAVLTSTGYGDGCYPVYAEVKDCGESGKRVSKIIIDFGV